MIELFLNSLFASLGIIIASAPVGCLLLWQRLAFFGDTIAHSALLGIAIALVFSMPLELGAIINACLMAGLLSVFKKKLNNDTILAIIAYGSLASAMVIISRFKFFRIDLSSYLFGDILAVNNQDIMIIWLLSIFTVAWIIIRWQKLLIITINSDLAFTENIKVEQIKLEFRIIIALLIACSMKIIGVLLITALMIIPSATARLFSNYPEQMVYFSIIYSVLSVVGGLGASFYFNTPASASIIVTALIMFILSNLFKSIRK
jgi:zinc transport system permease protein